MTKVNVVCMKWGTLYGPEYVNKLYGMVKRNITIPFNFICFTDNAEGITKGVTINPMPNFLLSVPHEWWGGWKKLNMFSPEIGLTGKTLFLDLDVVIVDNIDCFFNYADQFVIIENWTQKGKGIGNSSVYFFEAGKYNYVLSEYNKDPNAAVKNYSNEQEFLSKVITSRDGIKFWPAKWCISFKHSVVGKSIFRFIKNPIFSKGNKIIVFHGHPKPEEALAGKWPKKYIPFMRKALWIAKYWQE